jgi:hypothetical protein
MQSIDLTAHNEPAPEIAPQQIETPRVRVTLPPQFGQRCCYPIGEPRTPGFRYCAWLRSGVRRTAWSICVSAI